MGSVPKYHFPTLKNTSSRISFLQILMSVASTMEAASIPALTLWGIMNATVMQATSCIGTKRTALVRAGAKYRFCSFGLLEVCGLQRIQITLIHDLSCTDQCYSSGWKKKIDFKKVKNYFRVVVVLLVDRYAFPPTITLC